VNNLVRAVEHSILTRRLFRRDQSILVAVSGGLDSMVLLRVLKTLAGKYDWRLRVAHFNHKLRGSASDADERFVHRTAERLGLDFFAERGDVAAEARRQKTSTEVAARRLRHGFLARTARRSRIRSVALAHHADDQVELFFLRLLRGAGGEGLGGMKWTGPSPSDPAVHLVRPLLDQTKATLQSYARRERIAFREDATNAQVDIPRNRLRNKLLPLLSGEYQPALTRVTLRTMELVAAEHDFVRRAAAEWLQHRRRVSFKQLHPAVQRQVIQTRLIEQGVVPDFELVEQLRQRAGISFSAGAGLTVRRDTEGRVFAKPAVASVYDPARSVVHLRASRDGKRFGALHVEWRAYSCKGLPGKVLSPLAGREVFDADRIGKRIILRHWRPGDRFQPIGMRQPVKLQDLFTNLRIPREQRHQLVVAETARGELFWIEGVRIGDQFKLDDQTRRCLEWKWRRESVVAGGKTT